MAKKVQSQIFGEKGQIVIKTPKLTKAKKTLIINTKKEKVRLDTKLKTLSEKREKQSTRVWGIRLSFGNGKLKERLKKAEGYLKKTENEITKLKKRIETHPYQNERNADKFENCIRIKGRKKDCIKKIT